jgi:hypothetical protein
MISVAIGIPAIRALGIPGALASMILSSGLYSCSGVRFERQQIDAPDEMGQVLDHLFRDAWNCDALAVHGQMDPVHVEDLRERCCFFYRRGSWLLVHSRDPELQQ